jgi:hypothetical protein
VPPFRSVTPKPDERYKTCVPLIDLSAAAGAWRAAEGVPDTDDPTVEWVAWDSPRRFTKDMFVARVVGHSMEPVIPDGAYCLFRKVALPSSPERAVLVRHPGVENPETGGQYTVKRRGDVPADREGVRAAWPRAPLRVPLQGLTCSTFVLAVLSSVRINLVKLAEWPSRPADVARHKELLDLLDGDPKVSRDHVAAVRAEVTCVRYRPEEVAGAASSPEPPVSFVVAQAAAEHITRAFARRATPLTEEADPDA